MMGSNREDIFNILDAPAYSAAEASRLVDMKPWTVRRYLQGYEYDYESWHKMQPPVVKGDSKFETYASFLDLIDLLFVKELLKRGFGLPTLRIALDEARELLGSPHFCQSAFFTSGSQNISIKLPKDGTIIKLMTGGQYVIPSIVASLSNKLDFEEITRYGFARRYYPKGLDGQIVIDPEISFGRPVIKGTGIPTTSIYDLFLGEGEKYKPVGNWFSLPISKVKAAVQFEHSLWQ